MKPYSLDLREKIIDAVEKGDSSITKVAQRFGVSKNFVQKLVLPKSEDKDTSFRENKEVRW